MHWTIHCILFLTYFWGCDCAESVDQNTRVETAVEGGSVTINCTYQTSDPSPYLFWYQQKPNTIPKYMMMIFATTVQNDKDFEEERFGAKHDKTLKSVPLLIQDLRVSDSAVYYCALRPAGNKIIFGKGTQVHVETKTEVKPNIYQVGNSCLATDFTKHNEFNITDSPFLETSAVRYSGQSYYSSFKFSSNDCKETGVCSSSGGGTDLERDEKVNFLSLGIFWLRILFLKTVVFNVLVTFKAWMS
nr:T-cell receptor alpha variable region [Danio rerio]